MRALLKTPISYYGGKQKLVSTILPLIPQHRSYIEPYCGGAAVFWAKEPSEMEVINDANREVINFYQVLQRRYDELYELIGSTLHSRDLHRDAAIIYDNPHLFDEVRRAWALWVQTNQSFTSKIKGGWAYGVSGSSCEKKTDNAKERLRGMYRDRLARVQVECNDALQVIRSRDRDDAFHYCDPPYPETEQGHYSGYTMTHFRSLLDVLANVKGKFLLSCYPNELLEEYSKRHGWHTIRKEQRITAAKDRSAGKMKVEVLTANYPL